LETYRLRSFGVDEDLAGCYTGKSDGFTLQDLVDAHPRAHEDAPPQ
jgi:hypothetical protein